MAPPGDVAEKRRGAPVTVAESSRQAFLAV
jgi:hypothetical protein